MKYLHIKEYIKLNKKLPEKQENEYDLILKDKIIRSSVINSNEYDKTIVMESINKDTLYNNITIEDFILPLDNIIVYDYFDNIKLDQKIAYIYDCPVCLSTIITSEHDLEKCPHCENNTISFDLLALVNIEQIKDLTKTKDNELTDVKIKDDKLIVKTDKNSIKDNIDYYA